MIGLLALSASIGAAFDVYAVGSKRAQLSGAASLGLKLLVLGTLFLVFGRSETSTLAYVAGFGGALLMASADLGVAAQIVAGRSTPELTSMP